MSDRRPSFESKIEADVDLCEGSIEMMMAGSGHLSVRGPTALTPDNVPKLRFTIHQPEDADSDYGAHVRFSISPKTARELGEWLREHADDDPDVVLEGDGDE